MKNHSCPMCSCVFDEEGKVITAGKKTAPARDGSLRQQLKELKEHNSELLAELRQAKGGKGSAKQAAQEQDNEKSMWD